jgi:hypothetical protein
MRPIPVSDLHFLLGGHDLEMLEIKKMLIQAGYKFSDKNLSWGAAWADYRDVFEDPAVSGSQWVGIELSGKDDMPPASIDIDHHNERSDEPASIEQVAALLGIALSPYQKLVAANDKAYIPGLMEVGASTEEISAIIKADKAAQGVSEEDERNAAISLSEHLSLQNGHHVVYALCDKFLPIVDHLFGQYQSLIVYNDSTLVYYGKGAGKLSTRLALAGRANVAAMAYSRDGENGFWGIPHELLSPTEIRSLLTFITQIPA